MPKYNRKCFYCGEEYYCCSSCVSINSWKNTHCSIECFLASANTKTTNKKIKPIIINEGSKEMILLRAGLKNGRTIDITGYDLDLGKFDCTDNKTRVYDDFEYFIVSTNEMKNFTVKPKNYKKTNTEKPKLEENKKTNELKNDIDKKEV